MQKYLINFNIKSNFEILQDYKPLLNVSNTERNQPKMSIRISRDMPSKFLMDTIRKYQEQFVDI